MTLKTTRSPITTHILDVQIGRPAAGIEVILEISLDKGTAWTELAHGTSDADGRLETLLAPGSSVAAGLYRLTFSTGAYFQKMALKTFYPSVTITFEVSDARAHYHVPLLLSAFGYSTYRGT